MLPLNVQLMKMILVKVNYWHIAIIILIKLMVLLAHIAIQVSWKPQIAKIKPVMLPLNVQLMKMIPQVKYNNYFDKVDGTTGTYCYTGIMEASLQR